MGRKRKRTSDTVVSKSPEKKGKKSQNISNKPKEIETQPRAERAGTIEHAVLSHFFPCLLTLREYFLHLLGSWSSESRDLRTKYTNIQKYAPNGTPESAQVALLLDTSIVCLPYLPNQASIGSSGDENDISELTDIAEESFLESSQSELVETVVELLFSRAFPRSPTSVLTRGYDQNRNNLRAHVGGGTKRFGWELIIKIPNLLVKRLKSKPWKFLRKLVGEKAMLALLLMQGPADGSLFAQVPDPHDDLRSAGKCYVQMTGDPLCDRKKLPPNKGNIELVVNPTTPDRKRKKLGTLGSPLAESTPQPATKKGKLERQPPDDNTKLTTTSLLRKPGGISFYRMRIFYSRAALNKEGEVKFGLRHIHALNRFSEIKLRAHRIRMLKYIFPREFDLHNVFTSETDRKETSQTLHDYTVREKEINTILAEARRRSLTPRDSHEADCDSDGPDAEKEAELSLIETERKENVPKRLRGQVYELAGKLVRNNKRCSYHALLKHYCPVSLVDPGVPDKRPTLPKAAVPVDETSLIFATQPTASKTASLVSPAKVSPTKSDLPPSNEKLTSEVPNDQCTDFACTAVEVSAFCRAVVRNVFPHEFWGVKERSRHNLRLVEKKIDTFVKLRKFESFTVHDVLQNFKTSDFGWLGPRTSHKQPLSDSNKRVSLLAEFFYYLFDSFLIPLIRSHFYATETHANRYRVHYFRHDVWKKLTEPKLCEIRTSMLQELKTANANKILSKRELGFGMIRLLPKKDGFRMITNLRRRPMEKNKKTGKMTLGKNINSILAPVHQALKYEVACDPSKLGSSLFSAGDLHPKLKAFKTYLESQNILGKQKIYMVKVDVKKCFDTIPHKDLYNFVKAMFLVDEYKTEKHVEVTENVSKHGNSTNCRWVTKATPADEYPDLKEQLETWQTDPKFSLAKSTVFVNLVWHKFHDRRVLEDTLREHLLHNLIKIGKKYYHQKSGIPQGSVLSTILCNLFYADLEEKHLGITREPTGLLLRLIDDFLFLTLSRSHAEQFLTRMHEGFPEYGAFVNAEKSLVNFDVKVKDKIITRVFQSDGGFPYCGTRICEKSLDVKRDRRKAEMNIIDDALTVEYSRKAGENMVKKALNYVTRSARTMYFDTSFNSRRTVLQNLYCCYVESAMRLYRYGKNLSSRKRPSDSFIIAAIEEITELSFVLLNSKKSKPTTTWSQEHAEAAKSNSSNSGFKNVVGKGQIRWLAAAAFHHVYKRKQTMHRSVIAWLEARVKDTKAAKVDKSCISIPNSREMKEFVDGFKY